MRAIVTEGKLSGTLAAIPSKSCAHRLMICALLADGPTVLDCARVSEDIRATAGCLEALGASVVYENGQFTVTPPATVRRKSRRRASCYCQRPRTSAPCYNCCCLW